MLEIRRKMLVFICNRVENEETGEVVEEHIVEDMLVDYLLKAEYLVQVVGHYEVELSSNPDAELEERIDELENKLQYAQNRIDDALSYLHDVESELDNAYDECDID